MKEWIKKEIYDLKDSLDRKNGNHEYRTTGFEEHFECISVSKRSRLIHVKEKTSEKED